MKSPGLIRVVRGAVAVLTAFLLGAAGGAAADETAETPPREFVYDSVAGVELSAFAFFPEGHEAGARLPAVVIFHGGGWSIGEAAWGFGRARHYAERGMVAISAQYRLVDGPEDFAIADAMRDARTVIRWMRREADMLGIDPNRLAAYGWSAGAHLALSAAVFNDDDPEHEFSSVPNLLALRSPAVSLVDERWYEDARARVTDVAGLSPAQAVRPGLPPSIVVIGREDTVTPLAAAEDYHRRMLAAGNVSELIVYDGVGHLFTPATQSDRGWPQPDPEISEQARAEVDRFLEEHGFFDPPR